MGFKVYFYPKSSLLNHSVTERKRHNWRIWQPLIYNQFIAHKGEKKVLLTAVNGSQTVSKLLSFPTSPPEKLFLILTESKRRLWVIKWIMVRWNCRLGWETSLYGFRSNYKGELDRNSSSFHPQPWCSLDEAAVSLDLAPRSTREPRDRAKSLFPCSDCSTQSIFILFLGKV